MVDLSDLEQEPTVYKHLVVLYGWNAALVLFVAGAWLAPQPSQIGMEWAGVGLLLLVFFLICGVILWLVAGFLHSYLVGREVLDRASEGASE